MYFLNIKAKNFNLKNIMIIKSLILHSTQVLEYFLFYLGNIVNFSSLLIWHYLNLETKVESSFVLALVEKNYLLDLAVEVSI